ncbi:MAG: MFS transporter [Candidatus Hydrogenedentes bacterium]|nr:MFS transporter [Candidatus Hydrogenedentota bacterium]
MDSTKGWVVVGGALLALAITAGVNFFVMAVMIPPIMEQTGWNLVEISTGVTLWGIVGAIFSPFCGRWIDRYGARPIMCAGTLIGFVAVLLLARVQSLPQFYAVLALAAIGGIANTYIPVAAVVTLWFERLRGVAIGIAMLGLGVGGAALPQIANELLKSYSWRQTYTIIAFILLSALLPILLFIRNPKHTDAPGPDRLDSATLDPERLAPALPRHDLSPSEAVRTRSFWGISLGDALTGLIFAIFSVHMIVYLKADIDAVLSPDAQGISATYSADKATNIFSLLQLCIAGGTIVFGAMADKLPIRAVMIFCYTLPAVATALLLPPHVATLALAFALVGGLAGGGRQALFPVALAHSFGPAHVGAIYGMSNSFFLIGNAAGPIIGALIFEYSGSTRVVYGVCVFALVISAGLIALMRNERIPARQSL